jgi:hypothetical protein
VIHIPHIPTINLDIVDSWMNEIKKLHPCCAEWFKNIGKFFNDGFIIINFTPKENFLQYCVWRNPMIAVI